MLKLCRSKDNKWIFQKNISSNDLINAFLDAMDEQENVIDAEQIKNTLKDNELYKGRSENGSTNTMGGKVKPNVFLYDWL